MRAVDIDIDAGRSGAHSSASTMAPAATVVDCTVHVPEISPDSDTDTTTCTLTIPARLTIQGVAKRRAASGKLIAGVAAPADLELFKVCT